MREREREKEREMKDDEKGFRTLYRTKSSHREREGEEGSGEREREREALNRKRTHICMREKSARKQMSRTFFSSLSSYEVDMMHCPAALRDSACGPYAAQMNTTGALYETLRWR
jgi:hypothetical protein